MRKIPCMAQYKVGEGGILKARGADKKKGCPIQLKVRFKGVNKGDAPTIIKYDPAKDGVNGYPCGRPWATKMLKWGNDMSDRFRPAVLSNHIKELSKRQARERAKLLFEEVYDKNCHALHGNQPRSAPVDRSSDPETTAKPVGSESDAPQRHNKP